MSARPLARRVAELPALALVLALVLSACAAAPSTGRQLGSAWQIPAINAAPAGDGIRSTAQRGRDRVDPELLRQRYRPVLYRDQVLYCRSETVTGSRFPSTVCRSADDIVELERKGKQALSRPPRRAEPICPTCA